MAGDTGFTESNRLIAQRFRGFLPVVIDVETGGFNAATDALLEIAAVILRMDDDGKMYRAETHSYHIEPFDGANIEEAALEITGIKPDHPLRPSLPEREALRRLFRPVRAEIKNTNCSRAILVGHNAFFDLNFLNAAIARTGIKRNPFHPFSNFDTVTLGGVALGQTVLARVVDAAGIRFESDSAHSAYYDAEVTADLFCYLVNSLDNIYRQLTREKF
ncbi:MAG: ribonuclease T [Gammaproteobacteria bacterium]